MIMTKENKIVEKKDLLAALDVYEKNRKKLEKNWLNLKK